MKNLILFPFVIIIFILSCQSVDIKKKIEDRYKQSVQFFDNDLTSHFPVDLPDSCWYSTTVPKTDTLKMAGFGVDRLILLKKIYSSSDYDSIALKFKELSAHFYEANDSSLLLIFSYCDVIEIDGQTYRDQESPERQALAKHNISTASTLPVPIFEIDEYKGNTMSGLTDDFSIYVLEAKPGKYIDDKYLEECECLPEEWKHGYSKGVALSDKQKIVIYWLSVW